MTQQTYYSREPIALADAAMRIPALVANPHTSRSTRYEHVPTIRVLEALEREGFGIHGLTTAHLRDKSSDREGHQKHLVRLRRPCDLEAQEAPEVILINSHDGSCAYQLKAGMFRFACANGLIVGQSWRSVNVPHKGANTIDAVIEGTYSVVQEFDRLADSVASMKAIALQPEEQQAFARSAISLRYDDPKKTPVTPINLLRTHRSADSGQDLWRTFNRVQEGLIRGGARGHVTDKYGRTVRASVRAINGIDGQVKLNQALWTLAEESSKRPNPHNPPNRLARMPA